MSGQHNNRFELAELIGSEMWPVIPPHYISRQSVKGLFTVYTSTINV